MLVPPTDQINNNRHIKSKNDYIQTLGATRKKSFSKYEDPFNFLRYLVTNRTRLNVF